MNKRPIHLLDMEWSKYKKLFDTNPADANSFLNDIEISRNIEYCCSWPKTLVLNMTGACNILCRFCGQTQFHEHYARGENLSFLDCEKLKRIFDKIDIGYPVHVDLQGDGEPLIQKDFHEVYRYCRHKFPYSYLRVCTNGVALTPAMSEFLVEGRLSWLNVSLNAGSADVHEKVAGLRVFDKIIGNLSYLQSLKMKSKTAQPGIGMTYVLARYNLDDLENFVRICGDLGITDAQVHYMTVVYQEMLGDSVIFEKKRTNQALEKAHILSDKLGINLNLPTPFEDADSQDMENVPPIAAFDFASRIQARSQARKRALDEGIAETPPISGLRDLDKRTLIETSPALRCSYPWDFISLKGNGAAQLCCGAIGYEDGIALQSGFWDVWNGPVRRFLRRTVNSSSIDRICNVCPLNKKRDVNKSATHVRPEVEVGNVQRDDREG